MAVMMMAESTITTEAYDAVAKLAGEAMRKAPGFVAHAATQDGDKFRVVEIWESAEACSRYFAEHVHPNLPPGVKPQRTVKPLHNLIKP
jgi:quinol monooxygenase YgiN